MSERVLYSLVIALVVESAYFLNFFQPSDATTSSVMGSTSPADDWLPLDIVVCCGVCWPKSSLFGVSVDSKPWNSNSKSSRVLLTKFEPGLSKRLSDPCEGLSKRFELVKDEESGRVLGYVGNLDIKFERLLLLRLYE